VLARNGEMLSKCYQNTPACPHHALLSVDSSKNRSIVTALAGDLRNPDNHPPYASATRRGRWSGREKDEPGVVDTWPASGDEITLVEKESRTVRLELKLQ
jgi:hypothetical protein